MPRTNTTLALTSSTAPPTFGAWLQQRRTMMGLLRKEFADRTHFSLATIKGYELNARRPSMGAAKTLAEALNLPLHLRLAFIAFSRGDPPTRELLELTHSNTASSLTRGSNPATAPFVVPSPVTTLLGRGDMLVRALHLLYQPGVRLMSVVGPPGVGKTRFGIELAHLLREQFDDGVFFVALAPVSRAEDVAQAMCDVILPAYSASQNSDSDAFTTIKRVITNKQVLLILDNFEHLLSDATAQLVSDLLTSTPELKIIITSREALNVYGQYRLPLEPLSLPLASTQGQSNEQAHFEPARFEPALLEPARLRSYAAIALFEARAQATLPSFELTETNARQVSQLCTMLDGLPLAIEIAASNLDRFTVPQLLRQLESHEWALQRDQRGTTQRHHSLHNLISHSYALLSPDQQRVFCALSVFAGSADDLAVAMVMALPQNTARELLDHLYALAAKSMITREMPREMPHEKVEDSARFSMLETLREFGLDVLKTKQQEFELRRRHAQYFRGFAEHANNHMRGEQYRYWMNQLELNHNNCRAALQWCQQHDTELGLELATAWSDFWYQHGHVVEGFKWLSNLLGLINDNGQATNLATFRITTQIQAHALCTMTKFCLNKGPVTEKEIIPLLQEQCLPLFRQYGNTHGEAITQINVGRAYFILNEETQGRAKLEMGLTTLRRLNQDKDIAIALNWYVQSLLSLDASRAVKCAEEALAYSHALGNPNLIAQSMRSLSVARRWNHDYEGAVSAAQEAVSLFRHINHKLGLFGALIRLVHALNLLKQYQECRIILLEYQEVGQQLGLDYVGPIVARHLGHIAYHEGDLPEALRQILICAESALRDHDEYELGFCLLMMTPVMAKLDQALTAVRIAEAASRSHAFHDSGINPQYKDLMNEGLALAREQLTPSDFATAQATGAIMSIQQALEEVQHCADSLSLT